MKKTLLTVLTAAMALTASADVLSLNPLDICRIESESATLEHYSNPVAIGADGTWAGTGAFTGTINFKNDSFDAIGTSAFVTNGKWMVALTGSVTVNAVDVADNSDIYVAGQFADEVVLGSTDGKTQTIAGVQSWGEYLTEQAAAFIAHYNAAGELLGATTFIPGSLPTLLENPEYFALDPQVFSIKGIKAVGGKVYASAIYTGLTENGGAKFESSYNDPWFGMLFLDVRTAAVFAMPADLSSCAIISTCGPAEPQASDSQYQPQSVSFDVASDGSIYAVYGGNGPLTTDGTAATLEIDEFGLYCYSSADGVAVNKIDDPGTAAVIQPVATFITETTPQTWGYLSYLSDTNGDGELNAADDSQYAVFSLQNGMVTRYDGTEENGINYYHVFSAARTDNGIVQLNAAGYYATATDDHRYNDYAENTCALNFDAADGPIGLKGRTGVDINGKYYIESSAQSKNIYDFYTAEGLNFGGVENVSTANSGAPVEYFNLHGVRVANPATGLYIRRQGATATKVLF